MYIIKKVYLYYEKKINPHPILRVSKDSVQIEVVLGSWKKEIGDLDHPL